MFLSLKAMQNVSCPVLTTMTNMTNMTNITNMTTLIMTAMMTMTTIMNLEVVHKEVGGCLISYNLQLACVRKLEVAASIPLI